MVKLNTTDEQIGQAKKEAKELGSLRNSILNGMGNVAGLLSEIVIADNYTSLMRNSTKNWDLIDEIRGKTYDSKAKQTTVEPLPHYECSIANYNPNQKCDAYIFTRVMKSLEDVWVLGYLDKDEFFSEASFHKRGERDERNDFTFHADCWNVEISKLKKL